MIASTPTSAAAPPIGPISSRHHLAERSCRRAAASRTESRSPAPRRPARRRSGSRASRAGSRTAPPASGPTSGPDRRSPRSDGRRRSTGWSARNPSRRRGARRAWRAVVERQHARRDECRVEAVADRVGAQRGDQEPRARYDSPRASATTPSAARRAARPRPNRLPSASGDDSPTDRCTVRRMAATRVTRPSVGGSVLAIACKSDVSAEMTTQPIRPNFDYIPNEQLDSTMWQLARDVSDRRPGGEARADHLGRPQHDGSRCSDRWRRTSTTSAPRGSAPTTR